MKADRELRASLRDSHDEARAHANWEAIRRRRAPSAPTNRAPFFGALALGAVVVVATLVLVGARAPGPLVQEDGRVASGVIDRDELRVDDGSRVSIEPGGRLEILENTGDHVRFWLHAGAARFDIVPGGPRRWVVETGLVTVEVLGTAFRVAHDEREVTVSVERGSVLVRGPTAPGGMQRLGAGDSISVPTGEPPIVTAEAAVEAAETTVQPTMDVTEQPSPTRAITTHVPAPRAALETEQPEPTAEEAVGSPVVSEPEVAIVDERPPSHSRLRETDALRAEGRIDDAIALLASIADDPSAGSERALAAFTLARLELDRRHHPAEAAAAFAHAMELGLREPLLEDARARRVEALSLAGDAAAARAAAETYLAHHPEGRWRTEVERWAAAP